LAATKASSARTRFSTRLAKASGDAVPTTVDATTASLGNEPDVSIKTTLTGTTGVGDDASKAMGVVDVAGIVAGTDAPAFTTPATVAVDSTLGTGKGDDDDEAANASFHVLDSAHGAATSDDPDTHNETNVTPTVGGDANTLEEDTSASAGIARTEDGTRGNGPALTMAEWKSGSSATSATEVGTVAGTGSGVTGGMDGASKAMEGGATAKTVARATTGTGPSAVAIPAIATVAASPKMHPESNSAPTKSMDAADGAGIVARAIAGTEAAAETAAGISTPAFTPLATATAVGL